MTIVKHILPICHPPHPLSSSTIVKPVNIQHYCPSLIHVHKTLKNCVFNVISSVLSQTGFSVHIVESLDCNWMDKKLGHEISSKGEIIISTSCTMTM
jgi:hypothetical protein